jgi:mannose-6-phosphate isomerase-like protein (cupin superfamily)
MAAAKDEPFDLARRFVHLEDGPGASAVDARTFWRRRRGGRFVGVNRARDPEDLHPGEWEMHPAGDELVFMLDGAVDLVLDEPGDERTVALAAGQGFIVPRGCWHRFVRKGPCDLLFVVRGSGTKLRPV